MIDRDSWRLWDIIIDSGDKTFRHTGKGCNVND